DPDPLVEAVSCRPGGVARAAVTAEQAHDPGVTLTPAGEGVVDDLLVHVEEPLPRGPERVERARPDERLDRALVERLRVDAVAVVEEVLVRAAVIASGHDVLDEALPDIAHRGHTEPDRSVTHGEVALGLVHVRDEHRDPDLPALVEVDGGLVLVRLH